MTCPVCSSVLELTPDERARRRFLCLNCDRVIGLTEEKNGKPVWEMLDEPEEIHYFDVSSNKLIIMTYATGGFYLLFWFYRHWMEIKRRGADIMPFWRAVFAPFFCHELFSEIKSKAKSQQIPVTWQATRAAILWWVAIVVYWIYSNRDMFKTGTFELSFWPVGFYGFEGLFFLGFFLYIFVPIQNTISALHDKCAPDLPRNNRFSGWNIVAIVFGVLVELGAIYSYMF